VRLQFATQTNETYAVDYRNDLATGAWSNLATNLAGTGGTLTVTNLGGAKTGKRFYRLHQSP
jgi:hypothetical protein